MFFCHIQCIIPVRTAQADMPVRTGFAYRTERLQQNVFKQRTGINRPGSRFLQNLLLPQSVFAHTSEILPVLEIGRGLEQHVKVARLVNIELCRQKRPHTVIHPDTADAVAVCNKRTRLCADDGCVRAVNAHACEILHDHPAHAVRLHQKQRKAILPEITPAAAAAAIIVMRQKGAPINSS